jgi:hypothetical protein
LPRASNPICRSVKSTRTRYHTCRHVFRINTIEDLGDYKIQTTWSCRHHIRTAKGCHDLPALSSTSLRVTECSSSRLLSREIPRRTSPHWPTKYEDMLPKSLPLAQGRSATRPRSQRWTKKLHPHSNRVGCSAWTATQRSPVRPLPMLSRRRENVSMTRAVQEHPARHGLRCTGWTCRKRQPGNHRPQHLGAQPRPPLRRRLQIQR